MAKTTIKTEIKNNKKPPDEVAFAIMIERTPPIFIGEVAQLRCDGGVAVRRKRSDACPLGKNRICDKLSVYAIPRYTRNDRTLALWV